MKKLIIAAMTAAIVSASCTKEITSYQTDNCEIYATIEHENQTKTLLDENNDILWTAADQIAAFLKSPSAQCFQIQDEYVGKNQGYFSEVSASQSYGVEWEENVAYYPYSETVRCAKTESGYILDIILPQEQTYHENSFGSNAFPMAAVSKDNNFTFRNICGGVKLQLKGSQSIASVRIEGRNNEKLSGPATVTIPGVRAVPVIEMSTAASNSATLDCNGVQLKKDVATTFITTLPPVVFEGGFIVTITDTEENAYRIESSQKNEVKRSSLLVMPEITLDASDMVSIWDGTIPETSTLIKEDNAYIIDEAVDLAWLSAGSNALSLEEGAHLLLTKNIDMAGLPGMRSITLPQGCSFDGAGHTISAIDLDGGLLGDGVNITVKDLTIDRARVSSSASAHIGVLFNTLSGTSILSGITIKNSEVRASDGAAGGVIGYIGRKETENTEEALEVIFDNCRVTKTSISGTLSEGHYAGLLSGYDSGEKLTFKENCQSSQVNTGTFISPYREGNEGVWLASTDYSKYDGWLGNEKFYRGQVMFGADRFIPCWDGETRIKPLETEDKVILIHSAFDLAYLQNADAGTIRFMENVSLEYDLNGARKEEVRSHTFTPIKTLKKLEGNNKTIYNISIKGNYYAGFVYGSNCSTVFENISFDGADIRVAHDPEGGNAYAGTLRGFSYGRTTIKNVHVRNGYLYGVNKMGGLCGGIFSTLTCHDSSVTGYRIENYNSGIKDNGFYANGEIGGLFGYISNTDFTETSEIKNCTAKDNSFNCITYDAMIWDRSVAPFIGDVRTMKGETLIIEGCSVLGNNTYTNCETGAAAKFDNSWQCQTGVKAGLFWDTPVYETYTSEFVGQCYSVQVNLAVIEINDIKGTVIIDGQKVYYDYTKQ